jgi:hypothetical protein
METKQDNSSWMEHNAQSCLTVTVRRDTEEEELLCGKTLTCQGLYLFEYL